MSTRRYCDVERCCSSGKRGCWSILLTPAYCCAPHACYADVVLTGSLLGESVARSGVECRARCLGAEACAAWTFFTSGGFAGGCALFRGPTEMRPSDEAVSGLRDCDPVYREPPVLATFPIWDASEQLREAAAQVSTVLGLYGIRAVEVQDPQLCQVDIALPSEAPGLSLPDSARVEARSGQRGTP